MKGDIAVDGDVADCVRLLSVNHGAPLGPAVIAEGSAPSTGRTNSVISPLPVVRPIRSVFICVNHIASSGPAVIPKGPLSGVGTRKASISPSTVMQPIR